MEKRNKNGLTEKEFLEQYNPGDWERPSVTVDMMVTRMKKDLSCMQILLIQRGDHPYLGSFALPGGFVDIRESAYESACRELKEETNLTNVYLEQVYTMSQPNRDPRTRVIDIAYLALLPYEQNSEVKAGDDARDALWFDIHLTNESMKLVNKEKNIEIEYKLDKHVFKNGKIEIENYVPTLNSKEILAFDHSEIILEGLMRLKNKIMYTDVAFNLVPEEFTLPDLQKVYELILGKDLYKANFREAVAHKIIEIDKKGKPISGRRVSKMYRYRGV